MTPVPAYAIAYLRNVDFGDEIIRYMREIDDTLAPFGGEFVIHGGRVDVREGDWGGGDLVAIRFPDHDTAVRWYESADYQRIAALREDNSDSIVAPRRGRGAGTHRRQAGRRVAGTLEMLGLRLS